MCCHQPRASVLFCFSAWKAASSRPRLSTESRIKLDRSADKLLSRDSSHPVLNTTIGQRNLVSGTDTLLCIAGQKPCFEKDSGRGGGYSDETMLSMSPRLVSYDYRPLFLPCRHVERERVRIAFNACGVLAWTDPHHQRHAVQGSNGSDSKD